MKIDAKQVAQQLAQASADIWAEFIQRCDWDVGDASYYESPIEYALAVALAARLRTNCLAESDFRYYFKTRLTVDEAHDVCVRNIDRHPHGGIFPQVLIGNYRVDFLLLHLSGPGRFTGIAIECDGHAFHERTKLQAERDKTRDRELQKLGYRILRYTGSEIWRDAFKCAHEIVWMGINGAHDAAEGVAA